MATLELPAPVVMRRIAVALPTASVRQALVRLAHLGSMEFSGELPAPAGEAADAFRRLTKGLRDDTLRPEVTENEPDIHTLEQRSAAELLAGEMELDRRRRMAIRQNDVSVLVGWTPDAHLAALRESIRAVGGAVVTLPSPRGESPPTLLRSTTIATPFRIVVDAYGLPPYSDIDPTPFAAIAFILMFGMMFGDAGHGLLLVLFALVLRRARHGRLAHIRRSWPLPAAAGVSATLFGFLYGEFFGPTGIVPVLWLAPLEEPFTLLKAAVVAGAVLLAISYLLGAANRWRERGARAALYAEGGLAGGIVFLGVAIAVLGGLRASTTLRLTGIVVGLIGIGLLFAGTLAQAGRGAGGVTRGFVEIVDALIRIGSNVISFTRLAAFGMMHAALGLLTLEGARHLAGGVLGWILAAMVFLVGTTIALTLEVLVAGIQALRLEYYELFSRIFEEQGRPFKPFTLPIRAAEKTT